MEPVEYARLLQRRWKLVAVCVLVAAVAGWITTPEAKAADEIKYEAETVLVVDARVQEESSRALTTVQLYVETGEVPRRVAARLGFDGNPRVLAQRVETVPDEVVQTLTITATEYGREGAADLANAFAEEVVAFLAEEAQADHQIAIDEVNVEVADLQAEIEALDQQIVAATDEEQPTGALETQRDAKLRQYSAALDRQQELLEQPSPGAGYQILEPAAPELTSAAEGGFQAPRSRPVRAGLAGLLGLLLGAAAVLLVERVDPRVFTREQAEEAFALPVVAEIPPDKRKRRDPYDIAMISRPGSAVAEAYRSLRAAVLLMRTHTLDPTSTIAAAGGAEPEHQPHVILVTSPNPGEGKTTTVANLAAAFAEIDRTVLVLSCDFRRPQIHNYFGASSSPGLSDLLVSSRTGLDLVDIIKPTPVGGVRIATNGGHLSSLGAVAAVGRELVERARVWADVIIIDTPPILATNDAIELIPAVDTVVLTCRAARTTTETAQRTRELLTRLGAPVSGVALVGAQNETAGYSGYYYTTEEPGSDGSARRRHRRTDAPAETSEVEAQPAEPVLAKPARADISVDDWRDFLPVRDDRVDDEPTEEPAENQPERPEITADEPEAQPAAPVALAPPVASPPVASPPPFRVSRPAGPAPPTASFLIAGTTAGAHAPVAEASGPVEVEELDADSSDDLEPSRDPEAAADGPSGNGAGPVDHRRLERMVHPGRRLAENRRRSRGRR